MNNKLGSKLVESIAKYGKLDYISYEMKPLAILDTFTLCQIMEELWREGLFDDVGELCEMFAWITRGASLSEIIWYKDGYSVIANRKIDLETRAEM